MIWCSKFKNIDEQGSEGMVNIYQCECGAEYEITAGHQDNKRVNVAGILYIEECARCVNRTNTWQENVKQCNDTADKIQVREEKT